MLSLPKPERMKRLQVVDRFYHGKTDDDKSWDISREILDTGRLVLNENHRSEITFRIKPSQTLSK
jgi:hypothetical protein